MLHFLKELRKRYVVAGYRTSPVVSATIGFVGGSDLVKQQEQLGRNSMNYPLTCKMCL